MNDDLPAEHPWDSLAKAWHFADPGSVPSLSAVLNQWQKLENWPGAVIYKANLLREVIALPADGVRSSLVIKRYHIKSRAERCKSWLLASRAKREYYALQHLAKAGLRVPEALAYGEWSTPDCGHGAGLIMRHLDAQDPLPVTLKTLDSQEIASCLQQVGKAVAQLHQAGVHHPDLHAGNIMVARENCEQVTLIDLHASRKLWWLPATLRRRNLAKLFHSLDYLPQAHHSSILGGYLEAAPPGALGQTRLQSLGEYFAARTLRLEQIRLSSRTRRCWKTTSEFLVTRQSPWRLHHRRDYSAESFHPILQEPLVFEEVYKQRAQQQVGKVRWLAADGEQEIVVKTRQHPWSLASLGRGPLERAWEAARALDVRGLPNPQAIALATDRRFGLLRRSLLLTAYQEGSCDLQAYLFANYYPPGRGDPTRLFKAITSLAQLVRRLHDAGIYHRDLNPRNILVIESVDELQFQLVDLDSIYLGRRLDFRRRQKNLVQLGLMPEGHISAQHRLHFLKGYAAGDRQYLDRKWIMTLNRQLEAETIKVIARFSRQEAKQGPANIGDPRITITNRT